MTTLTELSYSLREVFSGLEVYSILISIIPGWGEKEGGRREREKEEREFSKVQSLWWPSNVPLLVLFFASH